MGRLPPGHTAHPRPPSAAAVRPARPLPRSPHVQAFIDGLTNMECDAKAYKAHLRDFLIQVLVSVW